MNGAVIPHRRHLRPGPVWHGYVLHDGQVVVGPARQQIAGADELWDGYVLSERGAELVRLLQAPAPAGRSWTVPGVGPAMLLMCGEANVVAGGGPSECWNYESVEAAGLTEERLQAVRLVANPAHTRSGPQALRDKRAWLSRGGLLVHTANTLSAGWWLGECEDMVAGRASHSEARAWGRGLAVALEAIAEGNGLGRIVPAFFCGVAAACGGL